MQLIRSLKPCAGCHTGSWCMQLQEAASRLTKSTRQAVASACALLRGSTLYRAGNNKIRSWNMELVRCASHLKAAALQHIATWRPVFD